MIDLAALRALGADCPVNLKLVVEGAEEQGTGGLENFAPKHADLLRADTILVCDTGNAAVGEPAVTVSLRGMVNLVVHVEASRPSCTPACSAGRRPMPSPRWCRPRLAARRRGQHHVRGPGQHPDLGGAAYEAEVFRADTAGRRRASLLGSGRVSDMLWARPAVTVLGIDCPPVLGSTAANVPHARARLNLRIPPGVDRAQAEAALTEHLREAAPWGVAVAVETEADG